MRLANVVCLVTGGASGIGEAIARRFAVEGAYVEIGDQNGDAANALVADLVESGQRAIARRVDVRDEKSVRTWTYDVMGRHGRIDVLINNAGISAVGEIHSLSRELWDNVLAVNVTGVFLVSQAVLPHMISQRSGSIINMSSCAAEIGLKRRAAYSATKGAILAMTKSMQVDYAPYGIRVNALLPGTIMTPFVQRYLEQSYGDKSEAVAALRQRQLAEELGSPDDVAYAALYLASGESRYVMGAGLAVDGGTIAGKPY